MGLILQCGLYSGQTSQYLAVIADVKFWRPLSLARGVPASVAINTHQHVVEITFLLAHPTLLYINSQQREGEEDINKSGFGLVIHCT